VGPGVVEAFYAGLESVDLGQFDYRLQAGHGPRSAARYFEGLMERMEVEPRLGTTSGKPWFVHPRSGELVPEVCGDEMSVGMTKFYRVHCFQEIGGFVRQVMWDGIDCHRARMLGWMAESVDDEPLRFIHLRPQGASQKGIWTGRVRAGFGQYFMGTSPLYYLGGGGLAPAPTSGADRQRGDALGLLLQRRAAGALATTIRSSAASSGATSTWRCWSGKRAATRKVVAERAGDWTGHVIRARPPEPRMPEDELAAS
jgi:hypothetical protein